NRIIEDQLEGKVNLNSLPERERSIITKAIARRPENRYANCAALITALEAVHRASLAEILIEPPSVQDETLEKKPAQQGPRIGRPTPARGLWREQGLRKAPETDETLRPAKVEADSEFEIHVPPKPKPRPPEALQPDRLKPLWQEVIRSGKAIVPIV